MKLPKIKLHVGDNVKVISGDDKGRSGKILKINVQKSLITVEGVNERVKHRKSVNGQEGGRITITKPVHISNVKTNEKKSDEKKKKAGSNNKNTK